MTLLKWKLWSLYFDCMSICAHPVLFFSILKTLDGLLVTMMLFESSLGSYPETLTVSPILHL